MPLPHDLDPIEARRRKVGEQEARDFRVEVLRWVQEEAAAGPIRSTLARLVDQELREVVRETIDSPATQSKLQQPILSQLETLVHDKIDQALAQARFHQRLRKLVKEEMALALPRESGAPRTTRPIGAGSEDDPWREEAVERPAGRRTAAESVARAEVGLAGAGDWTEGTAPVGAGPFAGAAHSSRRRRWWPEWAPSPTTVVWVVLAVAVLFGLALAARLIWEKLDPGREEVVAEVDGTNRAGTDEALDAPEPVRAGEAGGAAAPNPLTPNWRPIAAALPATLQPAAENDPLDCWFPPNLVSSLRNLAVNPPRQGLDNRLRLTFPYCIGDYAVAPGRPNLVVAAAQEAGRQYLALERAREYRGCRVAPTEAPPAAVAVDGLAGPGTSNLLNAILACQGLADALTVTRTSNVSDYLFVLFLALDGLDAAA